MDRTSHHIPREPRRLSGQAAHTLNGYTPLARPEIVAFAHASHHLQGRADQRQRPQQPQQFLILCGGE